MSEGHQDGQPQWGVSVPPPHLGPSRDRHTPCREPSEVQTGQALGQAWGIHRPWRSPLCGAGQMQRPRVRATSRRGPLPDHQTLTMGLPNGRPIQGARGHGPPPRAMTLGHAQRSAASNLIPGPRLGASQTHERVRGRQSFLERLHCGYNWRTGSRRPACDLSELVSPCGAGSEGKHKCGSWAVVWGSGQPSRVIPQREHWLTCSAGV